MSAYGYLIHHGIKGQKWGIRRFQNEDGSLTEAGKKRYGINDFGKGYRSAVDLRKDRINAIRNMRLAKRDDIFEVHSDKSLTSKEQREAVKEINKSYHNGQRILEKELENAYGSAYKPLAAIDAGSRLAGLALAAIGLTAVGLLGKNIKEDYAITKRRNIRWDQEESIGDVLKYEMF